MTEQRLPVLHRLVTLCAAAGRPLVFFDIETASMSGPPIEIAYAVLWPSAINMSNDAVRMASDVDEQMPLGTADGWDVYHPRAPLGLAIAEGGHGRMNPTPHRVSVSSTAIHGIRDDDLKDCPPLMQHPAAARLRELDDAGAVFAGHNIEGFDLRTLERFGVLPKRPRVTLDTMRAARAIQSHDPFPFHEECFTPAHRHGLDAFRSDLSSLHSAFFGERFDGAHGAYADVLANIRIAAAMLDMWHEQDMAALEEKAAKLGPEFNANDYLEWFLSYVTRPQLGYTGHDGWLKAINRDGTKYKPSLVEAAFAGIDATKSESVAVTAKVAGVRWADRAGSLFFEVCKGKHRGSLLHEIPANDALWIAGLDDTAESTREVISLTVKGARARGG
jgi:DNA polymerase III epsilon subunit-like protein